MAARQRKIAHVLLTPKGGRSAPLKMPTFTPPLLVSAVAEYLPGPPRNVIYISQLLRSLLPECGSRNFTVVLHHENQTR